MKAVMELPRVCEIRSAATKLLGCVAVAVRGGAVVATSIGHRSEAEARKRVERLAAEVADAIGGDCADDDQLADEALTRLAAYAAGEEVDFRDLPVWNGKLTAFQKKVVAACRRIPRGKVRSYGELATVAGSAGAARAVGQVMASNRAPVIVPCHRVVRSGGGLGGFSCPEGIELKRRMLAMEAGELVARS